MRQWKALAAAGGVLIVAGTAFVTGPGGAAHAQPSQNRFVVFEKFSRKN